MIANASLICTDSFHACVFSILFNKPFLVFERGETKANMNSRITTLLNKFNLEKRFPGRVKDNEIFNHNYEEAYRILKNERKKVEDFLRRSIEENYGD